MKQLLTHLFYLSTVSAKTKHAKLTVRKAENNWFVTSWSVLNVFWNETAVCDNCHS